MLRFVTSLTFLYGIAIVTLISYGVLYYRNFARSGRQRKRFPLVFMLIGIACLTFLYLNIHAPLSLHTFRNLDHHFIRHDGFQVNDRLELGRSDTVNFPGNTYNSFVFDRKEGNVFVSSSYSEEPFYLKQDKYFQLVSRSFPAKGNTILCKNGDMEIKISTADEREFELVVDNVPFKVTMNIRKGISAWNLFRTSDAFIGSDHFDDPKLVAALQNILLVRQQLPANGSPLHYYLSSKLVNYVDDVFYNGKRQKAQDLHFSVSLPNESQFAWGIASTDNNRNQYTCIDTGGAGFTILNRYPVSYPLTEEDNTNWTAHSVNKFLVSDPADLVNQAAFSREGFLFSVFTRGDHENFDPVALSYRADAANKPIQWRAINRLNKVVTDTLGDRLMLPSRDGKIKWVFSLQNSFQWKLGERNLSAATWQYWMFGSLFFFWILILVTSWVTPVERQGWAWQLLACVTLVLLTTRFFLYWRYKSFPPYDGLDFPSRQQLDSPWNFWIIVIVSVLLAAVFAADLFRKAGHVLLVKAKRGLKLSPGTLVQPLQGIFKKAGKGVLFACSWLIILLGGATFAAINHFDPGVCRHLAIGLTILYFLFLFISYRYSPLVANARESWWKIDTGKSADLIISNPVKVLLSISLLAVFVFTDIGFAIVFLNFLLFNESFLCINYAVAGLSTGSRRNAVLFGSMGTVYLVAFVLNLIFAPYIFQFLLELPQSFYAVGYALFAALIAYHFLRLSTTGTKRAKSIMAALVMAGCFLAAFFFFPKERIMAKAAMTKYRIDVLTMPVDKAIALAYKEGKTYEPVIRAAQNQWFISTLIYEKNNPGVNNAGFQLLPHAPQNKGAKYNAQATDLVASRFFLAEHGTWAVLLYVMLLIVPAVLLSSFYKLYPDFTNRVNEKYPTITAAFSVLNYLLITALLVILAATGRYIFFGQDMPFGSILSKQSILFPSLLIITVILLFRRIPLEYYASRKKFIPGAIVFVLLAIILFFIQPFYNRNREFNVDGLASSMDEFVHSRLQPILDNIDTASPTRKLSIAKKDRLFTDTLRALLGSGAWTASHPFFEKEIQNYSNVDFSRHLDQHRMLYLDLSSGHPQLAVNENYFRVEPPPHLQQSWKGSVYGDSSIYNISIADPVAGTLLNRKLDSYAGDGLEIEELGRLAFLPAANAQQLRPLYFYNRSGNELALRGQNNVVSLKNGDSIKICNPTRFLISTAKGVREYRFSSEPDAFMNNLFVNGSRYYIYPLGNRFIWARHFAEGIAASFAEQDKTSESAAVSIDAELSDSLTTMIAKMMNADTAYKKGAEYGISIADGEGRVIAMVDHIKGISRPDPNDKAGYARAITGDNGFISQSLLRKMIGNINLLRMNPGPGSTLKPIVFSAIASQLNIDWSSLAVDGFSTPQNYYGSEKVAEYDFEKNNGRITSVADYLRYSDNYYHSNVLLLGSYAKQDIDQLLSTSFTRQNPASVLHWPYFTYKGSAYWLDGFKHWPGYEKGKAFPGADSSFSAIGLFANYGIASRDQGRSIEDFSSFHDSLLFSNAAGRSAFVLPEYSLFDQAGTGIDHSIPYDVFTYCFRGHVKGSSQVMIPPVKMVEAFGKLVSQSRNYELTLDPYATAPSFYPFRVDNTIVYNNYLSLMREGVFTGMKQVLANGTAAKLGQLLEADAGYYYYGKTGTTGDDELKTKSKLFALVISEKDITNPGFNFRKNKFYTIYFTSQNGPAMQNEQFQAKVVKFVEQSRAFRHYMQKK